MVYGCDECERFFEKIGIEFLYILIDRKWFCEYLCFVFFKVFDVYVIWCLFLFGNVWDNI